MKPEADIEAKLRSASAVEPRRNVRDDFTASVIAELRANPTLPRKESIMKRIFTRPATVFAAVAITISLAGGATYAATDGFTRTFDLRNIFGYSETIDKDGNNVVGVKFGDCEPMPPSYQEKQDLSGERTLYVRVKADSGVSTDQVLKYIQGYCETIHMRSETSSYMLADESGLGVMPSTGISELLAVNGSSSITIKHDDYQYEMAIDAETKIEKNGEAISLSSLKPGQQVFTVSTSESENEPPKALLVRTVSDEEYLYVSSLFDEKFLKALERVVPCESSKSEFCNWKQQELTPYSVSDLNPSQKQSLEFVKKAYQDYDLENSGEFDFESHKTMLKEYFSDYVVEANFRSLDNSTIYCAPVHQVLSFSKPSQIGGSHKYSVTGLDSEKMPLFEAVYDTRKNIISNVYCVEDWQR